MSDFLKDTGLFILISIFLFSLVNKILNSSSTINLIKNKNMPMPELAYLSAVAMLSFGSLSIIMYRLGYVSKDIAKRGVEALIVFTCLATYYFHNMFIDKSQKYYFEKNVAIIGALIYVRETL